MHTPLIVPAAAPFLLPGGSTGCLLIHGFTSSPEEMRWLGDDLAARGYTVLGLRLAGHGTAPHDLARVRWTDWLIDVEAGVALLQPMGKQIVVIGQSLGGVIALLAAAHYPFAGVVALSTPYRVFSQRERLMAHALRWTRFTERKTSAADPALGDRREAEYPAYAVTPVAVYHTIDRLFAAMQRALPQVIIPALLMQSRTDAVGYTDSMPRIYTQLGCADKHMHWLDGFDHSVVRDPQRQLVFDAVAAFIEGTKDEGLSS